MRPTRATLSLKHTYSEKNSQNKSRICEELLRRFQHAQSGTILKCRVNPNAQRRERINKDDLHFISVTMYQKSLRAETSPYHRYNARSFGMSASITGSSRTIRHVLCLRRFMLSSPFTRIVSLNAAANACAVRELVSACRQADRRVPFSPLPVAPPSVRRSATARRLKRVHSAGGRFRRIQPRRIGV